MSWIERDQICMLHTRAWANNNNFNNSEIFYLINVKNNKRKLLNIVIIFFWGWRWKAVEDPVDVMVPRISDHYELNGRIKVKSDAITFLKRDPLVLKTLTSCSN